MKPRRAVELLVLVWSLAACDSGADVGANEDGGTGADARAGADATDLEGPPGGGIVVRWTIEGAFAEGLCAVRGIESWSVRLSSDDGETNLAQACQGAWSTGDRLTGANSPPAGSYAVSVAAMGIQGTGKLAEKVVSPVSVGVAPGGGDDGPGALLVVVDFTLSDFAGLPPGAKRIFFTSASYNGDLAARGSGDPLAAADAICDTAAAGALLGGSWKAWLSTSTADAIDRIADVGPWFGLDGQLVFNNRANLAGTPLAGITRDERGRDGSMDSDRSIWTGTTSGGRNAGNNCRDWSRTYDAWGAYGLVGAIDDTWTEESTADCGGKRHLICIEQ